ncbi:MAG: hypothetical protein WDO56_22365 [Gammaproteobacteria bacterium]
MRSAVVPGAASSPDTRATDDLLDQYPTKVPAALNTTGLGTFSSFSPFGFNGRFLYARASIDF